MFDICQVLDIWEFIIGKPIEKLKFKMKQLITGHSPVRFFSSKNNAIMVEKLINSKLINFIFIYMNYLNPS